MGRRVSISENTQNDRSVVIRAVKRNWNQFRLASPALKSDRDFILEGLNVHGWDPKIYQNISRELKADREIVRSAVHHDVSHGEMLPRGC